MAKVQPTLTVTIDDKSYPVSELSQEAQAIVAVFDDWRQREADLINEVMLVRAALQTAQNQLVAEIRKMEEAKAGEQSKPQANS